MALPMKDKDKKKASPEAAMGAAKVLKGKKNMSPDKKKRVAEKLKQMMAKKKS